METSILQVVSVKEGDPVMNLNLNISGGGGGGLFQLLIDRVTIPIAPIRDW